MANRSLHGSAKEMTAVIMNLKESRVLEKSVQTLSLEEHYASKLLDLNKKMVKFNYGRLKGNVNKIKTHLKSEDITAMRELETEGKFKTDHPMVCSSSNSTKIAAAEKRLKLSRYRRVQSAVPFVNRSNLDSNESSSSKENDNSSDKSKGFGADEPRFCKRMQRPKTTACLASRTSEDNITRSESPAEQHTTPRPKSTAFLLERIAKAQKASKNLKPQSTYSCHDEKHVVEEDGKTQDILDVFGPNPYEERRKKFLHMENETFEHLSDKKEHFVKEVQTFIKRNPTIVDVRPDRTQRIIASIDSMAPRAGIERGRRSRRVEGSLMKQLAEIRKTRYLRINDEMQDSTTNTLAKDYLTRTQQWRQYSHKSKSFRDSVQL